eukprot:CAMPEP_0198294104 /NCGR_PEP_ID=MMETSP1449-20131203/20685_1 /TAXON_ID=420275 /ORGANISM="Attheya septentrionalis, Strain CCMP2084" /LENGTH=995 /DNA_ID=CAMNT_0043993961 /DNA_START=90 /DNA_END=3077 /DNA_ORIENTATION=+
MVSWDNPLWNARSTDKKEENVEDSSLPVNDHSEELAQTDQGNTTRESGIEVDLSTATPDKFEDEESGVTEAVPFQDEHENRQEVSDLPLLRFNDHISLMDRPSEVRFRSANIRLYQKRNTQVQVECKQLNPKKGEERGKNEISVMMIKDGTFGIVFLRGSYTLVTFLFAGFLFIFCMQVSLFLFMTMAMEAGLTSASRSLFALLGTIASVPVFIHGMGSVMNIGWTFVTQTWNGHPFLRSLGYGSDRVIVEWINFVVYLGVPVMACFVTLFAGDDDWWQKTALTWFSCVFIYFFFFSISMVAVEIWGCLELVRKSNRLSIIRQESYRNIDGLGKLLKACILLRQRSNYSGSKQCSYFVDGANEAPEKGKSYTTDRNEEVQLFNESKSLYSKMTLLPRLNCIFEKLENPMRRYSIEEVNGVIPFITNRNWSLEKLYCRNKDVRTIAIISGPAALRKNQIRSSFLCGIMGMVIVLLLVVSFLVWLESSALFIGIIVTVYAFYLVRSILRTIGIMKIYQNMKQQTKKFPESESLYQIWESFRITQARDTLCWTMFSLEIIVLFLFPFICLLVIENYAIAGLFIVVAVISGARHYINAATVLQELGSIQELGSDEIGDETIDDKDWFEKARLSMVISKIGWGKARDRWIWTFFGIVVFMCALAIGAVAGGVNEGGDASYQMISDFSYPAQPNLPYPTCKMGKGLETAGGQGTALVDYIFLSSVAYQSPESTQARLDEWFGNGTAVDQKDLVYDYRMETDQFDNPVTFKLTSFPSLPGVAIVSVRGTSNAWDMLSDAQLWSAAALAQGVRFLLPAGEIWTPILNSLVNIVSLLESDNLNSVAFYKETTAFVQSLQENGTFPELRITGHSLGGGLAMITGAQTGIPAVALSGPNTKISRETFNPHVTMEQIDTLTFNIVPDRDLVAMIDDVGRLYQRIECRASANAPFSCHASTRSLCEIMYTCGTRGTGNRPAICECVTEFGYPKPDQMGNRTFDEACPS